MKLKVLLTFDHELSLGGVRSYQQNLFEPTEHIFELAHELNVPIILFTDVCCALRFRSWDYEHFFEPYANQIRTAMQLNHDVQLHLHPHWIDSEFRENKFLAANSFVLAEFIKREPPHDIRGIIANGIRILEELCSPARHDYRCVAYRGGGYNLAPCTKEILTALYKNGVRIDCTIIKGYRFRSQTNVVNFRNMPRAANWIISTEGPLNKRANREREGILEVPIASRPRNLVNNVPHLIRRFLYPSRAYKSGGWSISSEQSSALDRARRLFPRSAWPLCFDEHTQGLRHIMSIFRYHVERHQDCQEIIFSVCSHPKKMGPYQRALMRGFVNRVRAEYGDNVEFITARQVYDQYIVHRRFQLPHWTDAR